MNRIANLFAVDRFLIATRPHVSVRRFFAFLGIAVLTVSGWIGPVALAQPFVPGGFAPAVPVFPADVISRSITAEADWTRARAEAYATNQLGNIYYAEARKQLAEAISKDLDNYLKYADTYFKRRLLNEKKKMEIRDIVEERKGKYQEYRNNARERVLTAILTDRERHRSSIEAGTSLNKLLGALAETPVAYGIDLGPSIQNQVDERLRLPSNAFASLRVRSPGANKQTFTLNQNAAMDLSWWPDHLRQPQFDEARQRLEVALQRIGGVAAGQPEIDRELLTELRVSLASMAQQYEQCFPPEVKRQMPTDEIRQILRTDEFLTRLHRDVQRMRDTGRAEPMGTAEPFDVNKHGRDAATLAAWMLQNGVTFDAARKGDEASYHALFTKLADLYAMVGE